jgi:hypothetical protein
MLPPVALGARKLAAMFGGLESGEIAVVDR